MADILIRGMEMPRVCIDNGWYGSCPMDRAWCARRFAPKDSTIGSTHKDQWNKLPSWCPLAPLPEGHGRLGDLDVLKADIDGFIACMSSVGAVVDGEMLWGKLLDALANAKTIVPAEGGTKDGA